VKRVEPENSFSYYLAINSFKLQLANCNSLTATETNHMPKPFNASENHPQVLCLLAIAAETYHSPFMLFPIVYSLVHPSCHLCFF